MSREQMRKLLSEPTEEDRLRADNEELHRIAEQATERGMQAEAEVDRLRKIAECNGRKLLEVADDRDRLRAQVVEAKRIIISLQEDGRIDGEELGYLLIALEGAAK